MPAVLVTLQQFKDFLGIEDATQDEVLQPILDDTEALFLRECGRTSVPFAAAQTGRVEKQRGTGSDKLYLDYSISVLTSVVLGFDSTVPDETITVADKTVLIYEVGKNYLQRVDGGRWGCFGDPAYVHITYNAAADLPLDAALEVMRFAAGVYRQRGAEDASQEMIGGQQSTLRQLAQDPGWLRAVANHRREPL